MGRYLKKGLYFDNGPKNDFFCIDFLTFFCSMPNKSKKPAHAIAEGSAQAKAYLNGTDGKLDFSIEFDRF